MLRIRQIVFAVRDLEAGRAQLTALLGLDQPFRDPEVGVFGIDNAVYALGDHRIISIDSRQQGAIDDRNVTGRLITKFRLPFG